MTGEEEAPARVASLLAAGTELVCALGAGDRLVARSHECDTPSWVKALPVVSRPTFDTSGPSGSIDALVRERLRSGEPLYEVDQSLLAALGPDLLITQDHCEVCAVAGADIARGASCVYKSVSLQGGTIEGVLTGFRRVAAALRLEEAGRSLEAGLRRRLEDVAARVAGLAPVTVVCLEWIDPIFAMGNWGQELVEGAGGKTPVGRSGELSRTIPWEDVLRADAQVLLVAPCGFEISRTLEEMPTLEARPGWADLRAVRAGRVFVADGNLYFNRSSPSLFLTAQILAEILHPEAFPPELEGRAWRAYEGHS